LSLALPRTVYLFPLAQNLTSENVNKANIKESHQHGFRALHEFPLSRE
jgi:hypothetical protein